MQRLSPADVLRTSASVIASSGPALFVTAAICTAPALLVDVWLARWRVAASAAIAADGYLFEYGTEDEMLRTSALALLASGLVGSFGVAATQAGVLYAVVERIAGRTPSLAAAIGKPIARMPAAFGAMALVSCVVLFGSTCLVVPAIVLASLFYFAVPAAVIEELPPFRAVARSVDLTKGHRAMILALVAALVALFTALRFVLRAAWGAPPLIASTPAEMPASAPVWSYYVALALTGIVEAVALAVLSSVMYARLRQRDGIDIDALTEIFA